MERRSDSAGGGTGRYGMEPEYFVGSERFVSAALGTETCQSTKRRHRSSGLVPDLSDQIFLIKNRIFS